MDYKITRNNAYPEISLHDCAFTEINYESQGVYFVFKDGFCLSAEEQTNGKALLFLDLDTSNLAFHTTKSIRFLKGHMPKYITKYIEISDIQKKLRN